MKKRFSLPALFTLLALTLSGCIWYGPHGGYGHPYYGGGYGGGYNHPGPGPGPGYGGGWNHN